MLGHAKARNYGLDIIRASAILLVFIEHLDWGIFSFIKPNSIFGILGVELFFVLSGFLIGKIVLKLDLQTNRPSFKQFYLNRWFRTLPLYYCAFIIFQIIDAIHYQKIQIHWSYLVFLQNWFPDPHGFFAVSWSLAIEEWFYLILPWLIYILLHIRFTKNRLLLSLSSVVVLIILMRFIYVLFFNPTFDQDIRKSVLFHFDPLLIGVILAYIQKNKPNFFSGLNKIIYLSTASAMILVFIVFFIYLDLVNQIDDSFLIRVFGITWIGVSMAIYIAFFEQNIWIKKSALKSKRTFTILTIISLLSYSIYIWHYEINKFIYFGTHVVFTTDFPQAIISVILTASAAYISYRFIETTFLRLRKKNNG